MELGPLARHAGLLLLLAACQGRVGDPPLPAGETPTRPGDPQIQEPPPPFDPCANAPPPALIDPPLRRLTPAQYRATVRDLLGDPGFDPLLDDEALVITERGVRQLDEAAALAIERRDQWTINPYPCDPSGPADDTCAQDLIHNFGARAFRRPLTAEEFAALELVYQTAVTELGFEDAMSMLVEVILQSPATVYVDEGDPSRPAGIHALDDWALASRLSYFLWDTMPDAALFEAAATGQLSDPDGLRAEAQRMLDDPRAQATIQGFVWHWLQLDGGRLHHALEDVQKDPERFPEVDPALLTAMGTELSAFVARTILEDDGNFDALFNSRSAYVNAPLARLYGVEDGPTGDDWAWVELNAAERGGLLTRAAFLTVFAAANVQSPIRRGVFVLEEVLCNELGDPPPNANDVPVVGGTVTGASGTKVLSVRQDVEARTQGNDCAGCHTVINPVGFTFEHYDAIGRYRSQELGTNLPLDSQGALRGTDVDGPLTDALQLSKSLGQSKKARACFARRFAGHALGQPESSIDRCAAQALSPTFTEGGSVRDLILDLIASEAFTSAVIGGE
jgi:hypothetical protein